MPRFAERRQERRENRQERREERQHSRRCSSKASISSSKHSVASSCSSTSSSDSDSSEAFNNTYVLREKLLAVGDDFEIKKASHRRGGRIGHTAFYVDNKVARARTTINLRETRRGDVLFQIQERKLRARDAMAIEDGDGRKVAEIKKRAVGVVRENFVVKVRGDTNWQIHGSILDHKFTVKEGGKTIVEVHKNWATPLKDAYFIEIDEECDDPALALMVVIGLEDMAED